MADQKKHALLATGDPSNKRFNLPVNGGRLASPTNISRSRFSSSPATVADQASSILRRSLPSSTSSAQSPAYVYRMKREPPPSGETSDGPRARSDRARTPTYASTRVDSGRSMWHSGASDSVRTSRTSYVNKPPSRPSSVGVSSVGRMPSESRPRSSSRLATKLMAMRQQQNVNSPHYESGYSQGPTERTRLRSAGSEVPKPRPWSGLGGKPKKQTTFRALDKECSIESIEGIVSAKDQENFWSEEAATNPTSSTVPTAPDDLLALEALSHTVMQTPKRLTDSLVPIHGTERDTTCSRLDVGVPLTDADDDAEDSDDGDLEEEMPEGEDGAEDGGEACADLLSDDESRPGSSVADEEMYQNDQNDQYQRYWKLIQEEERSGWKDPAVRKLLNPSQFVGRPPSVVYHNDWATGIPSFDESPIHEVNPPLSLLRFLVAHEKKGQISKTLTTHERGMQELAAAKRAQEEAEAKGAPLEDMREPSAAVMSAKLSKQRHCLSAKSMGEKLRSTQLWMYHKKLLTFKVRAHEDVKGYNEDVKGYNED
eukprot:383219-Pyramimonas_sp.AAC.1